MGDAVLPTASHAYLWSTIRTFTPARANPLAHMSPAGPAPMMRTSTLDLVDIGEGEKDNDGRSSNWDAYKNEIPSQPTPRPSRGRSVSLNGNIARMERFKIRISANKLTHCHIRGGVPHSCWMT